MSHYSLWTLQQHQLTYACLNNWWHASYTVCKVLKFQRFKFSHLWTSGKWPLFCEVPITLCSLGELCFSTKVQSLSWLRYCVSPSSDLQCDRSVFTDFCQFILLVTIIHTKWPFLSESARFWCRKTMKCCSFDHVSCGKVCTNPVMTVIACCMLVALGWHLMPLLCRYVNCHSVWGSFDK